MRFFSRRALNSAVRALFSNIGVFVSVRTVIKQLLLAESAAQLRMLSKKVVIKDISFLALVVRRVALT